MASSKSFFSIISHTATYLISEWVKIHLASYIMQYLVLSYNDLTNEIMVGHSEKLQEK